jgi:thiosulfate/3-mercaptopyruvate sulfurtransferase
MLLLRRFVPLTALTLALLAGCGDSVSIPNNPNPNPSPTVQPDTLNQKVFLTVAEARDKIAAGAIVYDQRPPAAYATEHVQGAISFDWKAFAIPEKNGIVKETAAELEQVARSLGLTKGRPVVLYGDWGASASSTSRAYWTLEYIGHSDVYLLNGDFEALKAAGVAVDAVPVTPSVGDFEVKLRPQIRATFQEMVAATTNGEAVIVDTRSEGEFEGTDLRGNPRGGHVPGAVHIEWTRALDLEGKQLISDEALRTLLESNGVVPGKYVVGYCQSGVRSSFFYALLRKLNYPIVKNYDGSAWEWSRQPEAPLEPGG